MNKQTISAIILLAIVVLCVIVFNNKSTNSLVVGSIQDGQAYTSTTTSSGWGATTNRMLKVGNGTLGSVVITAATAGGAFELRDATSTIDVSSTTIATFANGAIGGTYTFDVAFTRGLSIITASGLTASTTITWR